MPPLREDVLTWSVLLGLFAGAACSGLSSAGTCDTDTLPASDPCHGVPCCGTVTVEDQPDGGVRVVHDGEDAGTAPRRTLVCGSCNG